MPSSLISVFAAGCKSGNLLGIIPPWYKYLEFDTDCSIKMDLAQNPAQFWLVGFGIIDILLRVAGIVAVGYVIYGGFRYMTSQGEPDKLKKAQGTIVNALIGVAITVLATSVVTFLVEQFK